jgi:hypothetical protein
MQHLLWIAIAFAVFGHALPASAGLAVPSPQTSLFPTVLSACPGGDVAYVVTVRDLSMGPLYGCTVTLDFSACPDVHFCIPGPATPYTFVPPASVEVLTDVHGQATFWVQGGGTCTSGIAIYATISGTGIQTLLTDGQAHAAVSMAAVDQDGDLGVTLTDATLLAGKGALDATGDLNHDGVHDAADDAMLAAHLGHVCPSIPTPTRNRSWGGLKTIYR